MMLIVLWCIAALGGFLAFSNQAAGLHWSMFWLLTLVAALLDQVRAELVKIRNKP